MKLSIVVTVLGQHEMASFAIKRMMDACNDPATEVVVIDNGGDFYINYKRVRVVRPSKNIGVYPAFDLGFKETTGDVVAFFHSDVMINEQGFDFRTLAEFCRHDLGLVGYVGSTEIDYNGGRGGGTCSNFQGAEYKSVAQSDNGVQELVWRGSPAEAHGRRETGFVNAAVVDGCAMIIRRSAWDAIGYRADFVPHHFYDRLISTQMLEAGFKVAVLGILFDHLGGQTVSRESRYSDVAREYCEKHKVEPVRDQGSGTPNWDATIYLKGETDWLREYRDNKHLVPIRV